MLTTFFLHNVLALSGDSSGSVDVIKENMIQAWELFQASSNAATPKSVKLKGMVREEIANEFRTCIIMREHAGEHDSDTFACTMGSRDGETRKAFS
jgi:hypothetical protein